MNFNGQTRAPQKPAGQPVIKLSAAALPYFYRLDRMNQHQNVYQEAVFNGQNQYRFDNKKEQYRAPDLQFISDQKSDDAGNDVTDRIRYGIPDVFERCRISAVELDYVFRVFDHFPGAFPDRCAKKQPGE